MRPFVLLSFVLLIAHSVLAHGGRYGLPRGVVPPTPRGTLPPRPAPPPPSSPAGTHLDSLGRPSSPGSPSQPQTRRPRIAEPTWRAWWDQNRHALIDVRAAVHHRAVHAEIESALARRLIVLGPTDRDRETTIRPVVLDLLDSTADASQLTACLGVLIHTPPRQQIADDDEHIRTLLRLSSHTDANVAAAAILALGTSPWRAAGAQLLGVAMDRPEGRAFCQRDRVPTALRQAAVAGMAAVLRGGETPEGTALLQGLAAALVSNDPTLAGTAARCMATLGDTPLEVAALDALDALFERGTATPAPVRAHALQAAATLLDGNGPSPARNAWKLRCRECMRETAVAPAAAMALGKLCDPVEDASSPDAPIAGELLERYRVAADERTRVVCLVSLGFMGGERNRKALLAIFQRPMIARQKAWAALALGIEAHGSAERAADSGRSWEPSPTVTDALQRSLDRGQDDDLRGAVALSIGLCGDRQAARGLRDLLWADGVSDQLVADACIALGVMRDRRSTEDIRIVLDNGARRPLLLGGAAAALGLLGDKSVNERLRFHLDAAGDSMARRAAMLRALGLVADRRDIEPLLEAARDEERAMPMRIHAIDALARLVTPTDSLWTASGPWLDAPRILGEPLDKVLRGY